MTIMDLKKLITNGLVPSEFLIFETKDCPFLAKQYVQAIKKLADSYLTVNSIFEAQQSSIYLLTSDDSTLKLCYTDVFAERAEDYSRFSNTIVICDQIEKSIAKSVEKYVITFPKLEDWQILAFAKTKCPGVSDTDLQWLIKTASNDIYMVSNELDKIAVFDRPAQEEIFSALRFSINQSQYKADLFNIVNALVDGNLPVLFEFLANSDDANLEPVVLANRALVSLKNIILITQNSELAPEECGISAKQKTFLLNKYRNLNIDAVKAKIKFLTAFDLKLKTSRLELSKMDMFNYLLSNLYYKITK